MRILIENGTHSLDNLGDIAMLQVAAARLQQMWPKAHIDIVTLDPEALKRHLPQADPAGPAVPVWAAALAQASSLLPAFLRGWLDDRLRQHKGFSRQAVSSALNQKSSLDQYDLTLMSGSGIFADPFRGPALRRLDQIERAQRAGHPTALMGQGLGPITDQELLERAQEVFRRADLTALRERLHGPDLLRSMGIDADRFAVTGDDSLAIALGQRQQHGG